MPSSAAISPTSASLVDLDTGGKVPLLRFLNSSALQHGWNLSVEFPNLRPNLSALEGELFALKDIGHELFPDLSHSGWALAINDFSAVLFIWLPFALFIVPFFVSFRGKGRPYFATLSLRFLQALASAHVLRWLTFLATSIPGPSVACQSVAWTGPDGVHGREEIDRAARTGSISDFFLSQGHNCGDLIFSGHMLQAVTCTLVVQFYATYILPDRIAMLLMITLWCLMPLQIFFVLSTRNHYSVDVVVASYLAPLNWLAWIHFFPTDGVPGDPRHESVEKDGMRNEPLIL